MQEVETADEGRHAPEGLQLPRGTSGPEMTQALFLYMNVFVPIVVLLPGGG